MDAIQDKQVAATHSGTCDDGSLYLAVNGHPDGMDYLRLRKHFNSLPCDDQGRRVLYRYGTSVVWVMAPRLTICRTTFAWPFPDEQLLDGLRAGFPESVEPALYAGALCYQDSGRGISGHIGRLHSAFKNSTHRYYDGSSGRSGILEPASARDFWQAVRSLKQWHHCPI